MPIDAITTKEHVPTRIIGVVKLLCRWFIITPTLISVGVRLGDVDVVGNCEEDVVGGRLGTPLGVSDGAKDG